jgi:hypothetical protein
MADNYLGDERRNETHGERLVKLETTVEMGFSSLGRSIDGLRDVISEHITEEKTLADKVETLERSFATITGGYRVFLKMCGVIGVIAGGVWIVATWVERIKS